MFFLLVRVLRFFSLALLVAVLYSFVEQYFVVFFDTSVYIKWCAFPLMFRRRGV